MSCDPDGCRQAVAFGLDGTLVDSAERFAIASNRVRADRGLEPASTAHVKRWVSYSAEQLVTFALDSIPGALARDLAAFRAVYAQIAAERADLFPGALQTLKALRARGFGIGVCTNKRRGLALSDVQSPGLLTFIEALVGGVPHLQPKPHAATLYEVMNRLGADRNHVLYVGHSEIDAEAAIQAQVEFVLVDHGYVIGPREEIKSAALIGQLSDLLALARVK